MAQKYLYIPNRAIDSEGISTGAVFTFYLTGTSVLADVYSDAGLTTPIANPYTVSAGAAVPSLFYSESVILRVRVVYADGTVEDEDPWSAITATDLTFVQSGTGAVTQTVQNKLRQTVSLQDFGVTATGADQTTEAVAKLTALGANYEGVIYTNINTRLNLNDVIPAIPSKSILNYSVVFQSGSGYRQQMTGIADNSPSPNTDTAFGIISSHYPDLMLNNTRMTPASTSATNGLSGISWGRGFYTNGTNGPRIQWQANFTKSPVRTTEYSNNGVGCYIVRTRSPERAGDYEEWSNGMTVAIGDYIVATNGYFYRATTAGTSTVSPTVSSGTQTVGGITWQFESAFVPFGIVGYFDELGRTGNTAVATGITQHWKQNPEDSEHFVVRYDAGGTIGGAGKNIEWRLRPTNSAGTLVELPYLQATDSAGIRAVDSTATRVLYRLSDARGLSLTTYGLDQVEAANGDTTPTVANGGRLVLNNTGATSITAFDSGLANQEIELYFTNGNTTLVNSATLALRGGINVTPAANQIIVITRDWINTGWVEKSRNF